MLEPRQAAFVQFYLSNGQNATQAALKAGYSEKSARVTGCKLLTNPNVREAVQAGRQELAASSTISRDWLVDQVRTALTTAQSAEQGQIVVRSAELLARMHGWIDDKPAAPQQLVNLIIQR